MTTSKQHDTILETQAREYAEQCAAEIKKEFDKRIETFQTKKKELDNLYERRANVKNKYQNEISLLSKMIINLQVNIGYHRNRLKKLIKKYF